MVSQTFKQSPPQNDSAHTRLRVEQLEDRCVPATLTVDTLMDVVNPNDGFTSLREAVNSANQAAETQLIQFGAGIMGGTITLGSMLPAINGGHTAYVDGTGRNITIQRDDADPNQFRLFEVKVGAGLILANLKLLNGYASLDDGGAVCSEGSLTVTGCELRNNHADFHGGAIASRAGSLEVHDSQINGNDATLGGAISVFGAIGPPTVSVNITHSVIGLNFANSEGGGLYFSRNVTATVSAVEVTGNQADGAGGGIWSDATSLTLSGTTDIHDNLVLDFLGHGGGVYVAAGTIYLQGISIGNNNALLGDGMYLEQGVTRNPGVGGVTYYGGDQEFAE
jgi:hypothetical protein